MLGFTLSRKKKPIKEEAIINAKTYKAFIIKAIGYISKQSLNRENFEYPEYNLKEIKVASEADSYIKMALLKYSYLLFKAGYELKSDNEDAVKYLKTRFKLMSFSTGKPMDILFDEIGDDLNRYSNAFLFKARVNSIQGVKAVGVLNTKPIGGYYRIDPTTVEIQRDKNGNVLKYRQRSNTGEEAVFNATEVIHIYLDKDASNAFGTPRIAPALEDVKLLRKIEGNVIALIYRFAIPLYQWIIGKPEKGFEATDPEIEKAKREIENMTLDGCIVTNEKTEIKAIGVEGEALDASKYLDYFEKRVFTALAVSETQMGRGTAKQNADSMEEQAHDIIKHIERVMSIFFREYILNELLLEGGFNPIFNDEDVVNFEFNEISTDTKVKVENAEIYKFQSNVTTFEEVRKSLGYDSDDVDESRLYANMIETKTAIDQIDAQGENAIELAKTNAVLNPPAAGQTRKISGNGKTTSSKPNGAVKSTQRPTNQYGTTSVKIKESLNTKELKSKKNFSNIYNSYQNICNDIIATNSDRTILFSLSKDKLTKLIINELRMYSFDGIKDGKIAVEKSKAKKQLLTNSVVSLTVFEEDIKDTVDILLKDIQKEISKTNDANDIRAVFNSLEYRLRFLINYILPKCYWYSYVKTGAHYGIKKAYIDFDGSSDEEKHSEEIDTSNFSIDDIPAFHAFCNCTVSFKKKAVKKD